MRVTVDECGIVMKAITLSGRPELAQAAEAAAKKWRFSPTRIAGHPVKGIGTITFNFYL